MLRGIIITLYFIGIVTAMNKRKVTDDEGRKSIKLDDVEKKENKGRNCVRVFHFTDYLQENAADPNIKSFHWYDINGKIIHIQESTLNWIRSDSFAEFMYPDSKVSKAENCITDFLEENQNDKFAYEILDEFPDTKIENLHLNQISYDILKKIKDGPELKDDAAIETETNIEEVFAIKKIEVNNLSCSILLEELNRPDPKKNILPLISSIFSVKEKLMFNGLPIQWIITQIGTLASMKTDRLTIQFEDTDPTSTEQEVTIEDLFSSQENKDQTYVPNGINEELHKAHIALFNKKGKYVIEYRWELRHFKRITSDKVKVLLMYEFIRNKQLTNFTKL
jgi:hypothetical protein